ncbi:MAG: xanthan lyase [Prevotella sp.]|nr:xanthan lyase [Prevotella sp.]
MYRFLLIVISCTLSSLCLTAQTTWGDTDYQGEPWVKNTSLPYTIDHGLNGRHLSVWASHGRFFDNNEGRWQWQRPPLFGTTEDLFTQTIVVPYLIPMLENAGAVVFTPRERDWQRHEVIVDNDDHSSIFHYQEQSIRYGWNDAPGKGFAFHEGTYLDLENPFEAGTARMAETTHSKSKLSTVSYQPQIPEEGRYAVYVSYTTVDNGIDDAHYTVWHKGEKTEFRVNQLMGGSTWVYLGTFDFDQGCNEWNRVVLSNQSRSKGFVTADAVRFGGGMGNIERGGAVSGMPRCLEGARYYAQWAGMPYEVYSSKMGQNDYADDINVRSLTTNLLCGGSPFAPDSAGRHVPIELSLAVHSDAGYTADGTGVYGSLSICTTQHGDSLLAAGLSREASRELATDLLDNLTADMQYRFGEWTRREVRDRNYSETRVPIVPSAILETLSHQNFGDMLYGQDPNFRFTLARSVYKTLLRYITSRHHQEAVVQPLAPDHFHIEFTDKKGEVRISWQGIIDGQEPTSAPTGYILYIRQGHSDFDNGTLLHGTSCNVKLEPNVLYGFRVAAVNDGGRSFPTEVLAALYNPRARQTAVIINGFRRLSGPAVSKTGQGFDLSDDIGVSYGRTAGWLGLQRNFNIKKIGIVDSIGLGFTTSDFQGMFIAGNDFNYVRTHAEAIQTAGSFSIVSTSAQAVESGEVDLTRYQVADLILGLEKNDGHSMVFYKGIRQPMQRRLREFTAAGGSLLVSGAYTGSDMTTDEERLFLADVLKTRFEGVNSDQSETIQGMGTQFDIYRRLNERHYAATKADILMPTAGNAFPVMAYPDRTSAAVAYQGNDYRAFTMGFPLECIVDRQQRESIMRGILDFLYIKK